MSLSWSLTQDYDEARSQRTVMPEVIRALRAVTTKLGEWIQQIPEITLEICPRKSKDTSQAIKLPR